MNLTEKLDLIEYLEKNLIRSSHGLKIFILIIGNILIKLF